MDGAQLQAEAQSCRQKLDKTIKSCEDLEFHPAPMGLSGSLWRAFSTMPTLRYLAQLPQARQWHEVTAKNAADAPVGREGATAVLYGLEMWIFAGYNGWKGWDFQAAELWLSCGWIVAGLFGMSPCRCYMLVLRAF